MAAVPSKCVRCGKVLPSKKALTSHYYAHDRADSQRDWNFSHRVGEFSGLSDEEAKKKLIEGRSIK